MFARKSIGLEIAADRLKMVLVGGTRTNPVIEAVQEAVLSPETIRISLREQNVLQQAQFVSAVRDSANLLLAKTARTGVSLPDGCGRVMLVDLDTRFKSRVEAADIIRWKLKKNFPFDINEAHLDFQVLQERPSGEISVLVSLISRQVISQYEELLVEAGLEPSQIDFTSFRLFELFAPKFSSEEDYVFITYVAGALSVHLVHGGILSFSRSKELGERSFSANRIFREITSSLLVFQDKNQGVSLGKVYCLVNREQGEEFRTMAAEATSQEPVLLDVARVLTTIPSLRIDADDLFSLAAALGAAVRNL